MVRLIKFFCKLLIFGLIGLAVVCGCNAVAQLPTAVQHIIVSAVPRDPQKHPFSSQSIWNMPIGSQAEYRPAHIGSARHHFGDEDFFIVTHDDDPLVRWYDPGEWGKGRCTVKGKPHRMIHVPVDLIVADANDVDTPNNAAAFLQPDGQTLVQMNPLARCAAGGPVFGYLTPNEPDRYENLYGTGITGGHGGSGLSSIGGTIRLGELLPDAPPIAHALKLDLYAHRYLYREPPGYRWPAVRADSYAFDQASATRYGGTNPDLVMGSLLAIPPDVTANQLDLQTAAGRKIFQALKDYGGYVVDDSAWDSHGICIEKGIKEEFQTAYGSSFDKAASDFHRDINQIFQALHSVVNNELEAIGGGGTPRRPLAPELSNLSRSG